ncbi:MAG: CHASE4 domain-containing protein [Candidatus Woesearchaeota archaeon]
MKLRLKIAILTSIIGLIFILIIFLLANYVLLPRFVVIEENNLLKDMRIVNDALLEKIDYFDSVAYDYSVWDSSYNLLTGENNLYGTVDFAPGTLERTQLDFIVIIKNNGSIVFARDGILGFEKDYISNSSNINNDILYYYFQKNYKSLICENDTALYNGLIVLPVGPVLISSRPILKSDGSGPVIGTIIVGKLVNEQFVTNLANKTHIDIDIKLYDSITYEEKLVLNKLFVKDTYLNTVIGEEYDLDNIIQIIPIDEKQISANILLKDIFGENVLLLRIVENRSVYLNGLLSVNYIVNATWISILLLIIIEYLLFNYLITSRLISMANQLNSIIVNNSKSRIIVTGKDELSNFAKTVNITLDTVEKANAEKRAIFEANPDSYFYVDSSWNIIDYKISDSLKKLFYTKDTLKDSSLSKLFDTDKMNILLKARNESDSSKKPVLTGLSMSLSDSIIFLELRIINASINTTKSDSTDLVKTNQFYLIILEDITARKNFEKELLDKNNELEKFNKIAVDRELKLINLKNELNDLKNINNPNTNNNTKI